MAPNVLLTRCTGILLQSKLIPALEPWAAESVFARSFSSTHPAGQSHGEKPAKTPEARVAFKSPSGVSRTQKSADLAKDLGVEVEKVNSGVEGQKVLNFKGMGQGIAGQNKAAVLSNKRDVFKASHERQAQVGADINKTNATAHSAQNKYVVGSHSAAAASVFPQKPQARGERLSEDRYRDTGSMIEKAARQPAQPCSREEEENTVSRYQAMKAAASSALNRASGIYASNQVSAQEYGRAATQAVESAYRKGRDALDQGLQAMKDMATSAQATDENAGPSSKEFPTVVPADNNDVKERPMRPESGSRDDAEGAWSSGGSTYRVHPRGKGVTQQIGEEVAHRGERDLTSY